MMNLTSHSIGAVVSALVLASAAQAHDIVIVPQAGGALVRYGHPHDWQVLEKGKLVELLAFGEAGPARDRAATLKRHGLAYRLAAERGTAGQPLLLAARYDNGLLD